MIVWSRGICCCARGYGCLVWWCFVVLAALLAFWLAGREVALEGQNCWVVCCLALLQLLLQRLNHFLKFFDFGLIEIELVAVQLRDVFRLVVVQVLQFLLSPLLLNQIALQFCDLLSQILVSLLQIHNGLLVSIILGLQLCDFLDKLLALSLIFLNDCILLAQLTMDIRNRDILETLSFVGILSVALPSLHSGSPWPLVHALLLLIDSSSFGTIV